MPFQCHYHIREEAPHHIPKDLFELTSEKQHKSTKMSADSKDSFESIKRKIIDLQTDRRGRCAQLRVT